MVALKILRLHRLLEMYLHQVLGYDWDKVHGEADRLEHVISEDFEMRIDQALGHPSHDPHGDPIPAQDLSMPESPRYSFSGGSGSASGHSPCRQRRSRSAALFSQPGSYAPGAASQILEHLPFDENMRIQLEGSMTSLTLGPAITRQIFIEIL